LKGNNINNSIFDTADNYKNKQFSRKPSLYT